MSVLFAIGRGQGAKLLPGGLPGTLWRSKSVPAVCFTYGALSQLPGYVDRPDSRRPNEPPTRERFITSIQHSPSSFECNPNVRVIGLQADFVFEYTSAAERILALGDKTYSLEKNNDNYKITNLSISPSVLVCLMDLSRQQPGSFVYGATIYYAQRVLPQLVLWIIFCAVKDLETQEGMIAQYCIQ